jgi:hypothetical protein
VLDEEHLTHAAGAQLADDPVASDLGDVHVVSVAGDYRGEAEGRRAAHSSPGSFAVVGEVDMKVRIRGVDIK